MVVGGRNEQKLLALSIKSLTRETLSESIAQHWLKNDVTETEDFSLYLPISSLSIFSSFFIPFFYSNQADDKPLMYRGITFLHLFLPFLLYLLLSSLWSLSIFSSLTIRTGLSIILSEMKTGYYIPIQAFANGPGDWGSIPGRVIPNTQKWYLIPPWLTLCIIM